MNVAISWLMGRIDIWAAFGINDASAVHNGVSLGGLPQMAFIASVLLKMKICEW